MPRPAADLTPADLVVLGLLLERPMHGYEVNQQLELREVRDWAGVSRPQVYYSLRKLAGAGHIGPSPGDADDAKDAPAERGPERRIYRVTEDGRQAYADALARPEWTTQRPPPAFVTWLVLATHADAAVRAQQLERRRAFLEAEAARERVTLAAIRTNIGPAFTVAALVVSLTIRQFEAELEWIDEVAAALASEEPESN